MRVDIPKKDATDGPNGTPNGNGNITHGNDEDDEEPTVPVTLVGPQPLAYEAQELLKQIIASRTSSATQRVRDIPAHVLPFVLTHRAHFLAAAPEGTSVNLALDAPLREITASGDREAVVAVVARIRSTVEELGAALTSVKIALPKRQHRLLTGTNAAAVLAKSGCAVVVGSSEEAGDEVTVWGAPADLPKGLAAAMEQANSQYIHEYPLPGPASLSRQLATYLARVGYEKTLTADHPGVDVYLPAPEAKAYNVDLVGAKPDVDAVVKQLSELFGRLIGGTRGVEVDSQLHWLITGKNAKK